jgi:UDP-3-O-[3-hydroxymyristoyl] glucosamine N-acyltransferase
MVKSLRRFEDASFDDATFALAKKYLFEDLLQHPAKVFITDILPSPEQVIQLEQVNKTFLYNIKARLQMAKISSLFEDALKQGDYEFFNEGWIAHKTAEIGYEVSIGEGTIIHSNVTIYSGVTIGDNCTIMAGAVIGSEGFGYEKDEDGDLFKIAHLGGVVIGNNVDIGANTCIDRGTLGHTIIEDGVKIDNLVHIAHNAHIKKGSVIIANAMIAGSVVVGENSWVAPSSSIREGLKIGNNALVGLGAVVVKDVDSHTIVKGNPAK